MVLLHAWGDSPEFWRPLLDRLPSTVHALVPAGRGHGGADAPENGYALADFAEDVALFLDAVSGRDAVTGLDAVSGLDAGDSVDARGEADSATAILVGHSSGGYIARAAAAAYPERMAGLVLIGSPYSLHGRRPGFADAIERLRDPIAPETLASIRALFPAPPSVPAAIRDAVARDARSIPARVWQQTLAGLTSATPPVAPPHPPPTLVIHGADDPFLDLSDAHALFRDLDGELAVIDGAGHLVLWDDPDRVAALLLQFLGRIRPAATNYH